MPQQVHFAQVEGLADGLYLRHITGDVPQGFVSRPGRGAGTQLIESDDPQALFLEPAMAVTQIIARQSRAAIEAQQHFVAVAKAIGHQTMTIDFHVVPLVWLDLTPHHCSPAQVPPVG
ncbi:hypothetical protein D3C84_798840 [compost metagenome]